MLNPSDTLRSRAAEVSTMKFRPPWYVLPKLTTPVASTKPMTCPKSPKWRYPNIPQPFSPYSPCIHWTTSLDLGRHFKRAQLIVIYLYLSIICYNFNLHWLIDCQLIASFLSNFELLAELRRIPNSVACNLRDHSGDGAPGRTPGHPFH